MSFSYFFTAKVIHKGFAQIEQKDAETNLSRIEDSIQNEHESMINKLGDWAQWDDCYKYIQDRNKIFVKANLQPTLTLSKFDIYTFWSLDKKLVWGTSLNLKTENDSEKIFPLPPKDIETISKINALHEFKDYKDKRFLYINLESGPYLLVSVPITTTDGKAPVNGKIITGIKLDKEFFSKMSNNLHLNVVPIYLPSLHQSPDLVPILSKFQSSHAYFDKQNDEILSAYLLIKDDKGKNLILMNNIMPRDIHLQAHKTLEIFFTTMIVSGILLVFIIILVIDRFVLSKLLKLIKVIKEVSATGNLKLKVPNLGFGEIGLLASSFNEMTDEIDHLKTKSIQNEKMVSLGQIAGSISHEINNPLDIISGRVANIRLKRQNNNLTEEYISQSLDSIDKMVERVSKIIRGLKIIARNADADPLTEKNIKDLIEETLEYCEHRFKQDAITIKLDNAIPCNINCREVQLSQVLINLIGNSIDAIQGLSERWIEVKTEQHGDIIFVKVTDSGSGIPQDIFDKIMTPFFTTKEVGKGTGLGLSISKSIIEEHGGSLALNKNSTYTQFIIELPIKRNT
jgi:signal transduction histidine kinase